MTYGRQRRRPCRSGGGDVNSTNLRNKAISGNFDLSAGIVGRSSVHTFHIMTGPPCTKKRCRNIRLRLSLSALFLVSGCGFHFSGAPGDTPFPPDLKTIVLESAINKTTVRGIETELTNVLRSEFALGTRLRLVRRDGDTTLKTVIASYDDPTSTFRADGKELTRIGTLRVNCVLERNDPKKILWKKDLSASHSYNVTDSISGTLSNRSLAISRMIKNLTPRIHRSIVRQVL